MDSKGLPRQRERRPGSRSIPAHSQQLPVTGEEPQRCQVASQHALGPTAPNANGRPAARNKRNFDMCFLKLSNVKQEPSRRPIQLFQRNLEREPPPVSAILASMRQISFVRRFIALSP